ncbi:hypothetical protein LDENG_00088230, partial [Lucifuga dentata]
GKFNLCWFTLLPLTHTDAHKVLGHRSNPPSDVSYISRICLPTVYSADLETLQSTMKLLLLLLLLGCLGTVFGAAGDRVRWCVKSEAEFRKCADLARQAPVFTCVKKTNTLDCITAIKVRTSVDAKMNLIN